MLDTYFHEYPENTTTHSGEARKKSKKPFIPFEEVPDADSFLGGQRILNPEEALMAREDGELEDERENAPEALESVVDMSDENGHPSEELPYRAIQDASVKSQFIDGQMVDDNGKPNVIGLRKAVKLEAGHLSHGSPHNQKTPRYKNIERESIRYGKTG